MSVDRRIHVDFKYHVVELENIYTDDKRAREFYFSILQYISTPLNKCGTTVFNLS